MHSRCRRLQVVIKARIQFMSTCKLIARSPALRRGWMLPFRC